MVLVRAQSSKRAGHYIKQSTGYEAFVPKPLPFAPPIQMNEELISTLSKADQALGRLDASADILPNPDLFVRMYVRKEAVLSSQIEGTQASLTDLLEYEASPARRRPQSDVIEVSNYVRAMNHGIERLDVIPISNRLLREIHAELLRGVRGSNKSPGEFRSSQVWIGPSESDLSAAVFVPPPAHEVERAIGDLESYMHKDVLTPVLIKAGLVHSQFETIHPFLDGNGRMGRLLITFLLCQQEVLKRPLLYLSAYFKEHRDEYYSRLQAVRDSGDIEGWLQFFLTAVWRVSDEAAETARQILALREQHRLLVQSRTVSSVHGLELLDSLYEHPYITVNRAAGILGVAYPTANNLINNFANLGLLQEITGQTRDRIFKYSPYLDLMETGIGASAS